MKITKKEIKRSINDLGAFLQMPITVIDRNSLDESLAKQIPENAFPIKGIASNGELNRNDYIIRESAWKNAIPGYMENPIILFQHDPEKAIGTTISATVSDAGLEVVGYIDADLDREHAKGAIQKGIYKALSTGHLTADFEFENAVTGEVITKEEFRKMAEEMGWFGSWSEAWKMAVTSLEWVEWSVVAIGSNRAALRTTNAKDILTNFYNLNADQPDSPDDTQPTAETPAQEAADDQDEEPDDTSKDTAEAAPENTEKPGETPSTEVAPQPSGETPAPAPEQAPAVVPDAPKPEAPALAEDKVATVEMATPDPRRNEIDAEALKAQVNELVVGAIKELRDQVSTLAKVLVELDAKQSSLSEIVKNIPVRKGLVSTSQFLEQKNTVEDKASEEMRALFGRAGVSLGK